MLEVVNVNSECGGTSEGLSSECGGEEGKTLRPMRFSKMTVGVTGGLISEGRDKRCDVWKL